jgi:exodeoxyribonuclease VII large subunit
MSRILRAMGHRLELDRRQLGALASRLEAVSPLAVLGRGYCLCRKLPGLEVVTRAASLAEDDGVLLRFHEGEALCTVREIRGEKED